MTSARKDRLSLGLCALLVLATLAAYWPVFRCDFVAFDDETYVTRNPQVQQGLTPQALAWAFSTRRAANWHPLTWLSHMLDCRLFGLHPLGHHAVNLSFHLANTVLLFILLTRLTGARWRSVLVAGLFALHPLHVESVAWVAERKDVLSTCFGLLSLLAYLQHLRSVECGVSSERPRAPAALKSAPGQANITHYASRLTRYYLLSLLLFACSLMSKPTLVTLPCLLLLLDYWPLQRLRSSTINHQLSTLLLEKLPFLLLSAAVCVTTCLAQFKGGAVPDLQTIPFGARCAGAAVGYARYLGKTVWPFDLCAFYQYHLQSAGRGLAAGLLLLSLTALMLWAGRKRPYLTVGWLWFLGTLVPMIGLVQAGDQAIADRYTYVPLIGLFITLAWSLRRSWRALVLPASLALLAVCGVLTFRQVGFWHNTQALFEHVLAISNDNYRAQAVLGVALQDAGQAKEANAHFREALRLFPANPAVHNDFARALLRQDQLEESAAEATAALALLPVYPEAHINLGCALGRQGKTEAAISHFREALRLDRDNADAHSCLGTLLLETDSLEEAISHFQAALKLEPSLPDAQCGLGKALNATGRSREALPCFETALRLQPDLAEARLGLAEVLAQQARVPEALAQYRRLLRSDSSSPQVLNNLAWLLATHRDAQFRNGAEAVALAERACAVATNSWSYLDTLAASYAEAGRFEEAIAALQSAITRAEQAGQPEATARYRARLDLYRQHQPYHEP